MTQKNGVTTVADQSLIIHLKSATPEETRNDIINALGATMRWKSAYTDDHNGDANNMQRISDLIEVLTNVSDWSK